MQRLTAAAALALILSGCTAEPTGRPANPGPIATATVQAKGETVAVATANADAADDPAIWRNPRDPAKSLIVATDKQAGLHVYALSGEDLSFFPAGRVNNVDLRDMGPAGIIVAASDRSDKLAAKAALFRLVPGTAKLEPLGKLDAGVGEAYGICLYREGRTLYAFNVLKDGTINQMAIDLAGATPQGRIVRTMKLATQSEGCVTDERTHRVYVAEEDAGIWRFDAGPTASTTPHRVATADGAQIVADTEGLALAIEGSGNGGYLLASSQGDNAYAVYRLRDDRFMGRFRIAAGTFGATEETDGIELAVGNFGPGFPGGLFIAQDGQNLPRAQNFKLAAWQDIKHALGLR